jgi:hypothetical protein
MFRLCSLIMFDPKFQDSFALYIIWVRPRQGPIYTLAAGGFRAMEAAWNEVQAECPTDELTFQQRSRILKSRPPLIRHD